MYETNIVISLSSNATAARNPGISRSPPIWARVVHCMWWCLFAEPVQAKTHWLESFSNCIRDNCTKYIVLGAILFNGEENDIIASKLKLKS